MNVILASKSPRRREILSNLGVHFDIVTADTDESSDLTSPYALVEELSRRKGEAVRELLLSQGQDLTDTVIIASDTVVSIDGEHSDGVQKADIVIESISPISFILN